MSRAGVLQVVLSPDILAALESHAKPIGLKASVFARTLILTGLAGLEPRKGQKKVKR